MKKIPFKIGIISLMVLTGVTFNACEEAEEDPSKYYQEEIEEEYYEEDNSPSQTDTEPLNNSGSISDRAFVSIYYHFSSQSCQSIELKNSLLEEYQVTAIVTEVSNNSVTCASYGKTDQTCSLYDAGYDIDTSCIIGMNSLATEQTEKRTNTRLFLENIQEHLISQF